MFLHFNNKSAHCIKTPDRDNDGEYYWTWQVFMGNLEQKFLAQGFSIRPELDDGIVIKEGEGFLELNDPKFTIELPELAIGERRKIRVDLFCWEHDARKDTAAVKKAFTNAALQKLVMLHKHRNSQAGNPTENLMNWLDEAANETFTRLGMTAVVTPFIPIAAATLPLMGQVIERLKDNRDDLVGVKQVELIYTKLVDGRITYRWIRDNGAEETQVDEHPPIWNNFEFRRADSKEIVQTKSFFQVILHRSDVE